LTATNYSFSAANGTITVSIATPVVTVTVGSYTFNGSAQGPNTATNTGTGTSYTFSYSGTGGTTYGPSATRPTNAGSYTATATVAADGNFGSASSSARASATTDITDIYLAGNLTTANTFGIVEIYIPNYAGTAKKPVESYGASERNATAVTMAANAGLIDLTSAITSISLLNNSTKQFLTGSSFKLYGISNA
jgi:hypothetical protein